MEATIILAAVVTGVTAVCTGLVTAGATLGASVLLIRHQYQVQQRERKRERLVGRLEEVRRYVIRSLRGSDLLCDFVEEISEVSGGERDRTSGTMKEMVEDYLEEWPYNPVSGSSKLLLVADGEMRKLLSDLDERSDGLCEACVAFAESGAMGEVEEILAMRDAMAGVAERIGSRGDELVDRI